MYFQDIDESCSTTGAAKAARFWNPMTSRRGRYDESSHVLEISRPGTVEDSICETVRRPRRQEIWGQS